MRKLYNIIRSLLFTAIVLVAALYVLVYVLISVPAIQKEIRQFAQEYVSDFLGAKVTMDGLELAPFNEVIITGLYAETPDGRPFLHVDRLGAGINLFKLIRDKRIELTYAEVIGLDASIWQDKEKGPYNIEFIIKAFAPKDNKKKSSIDLTLHNVVLRRSQVSFDRNYITKGDDKNRFDANHVSLKDLKADVTIPYIRDGELAVSLRRLAFKADCGFDVEGLGAEVALTRRELSVKNFRLELPKSRIELNDQKISFPSVDKLVEGIKTQQLDVNLRATTLYPPEFSPFFAPLAEIEETYVLYSKITGTLDHLSLRDFSLYPCRRNTGLRVNLTGSATGLVSDKAHTEFDIKELNASIPATILNQISLGIKKSDRHFPTAVLRIFDNLGNTELKAAGSYSLDSREGRINATVISEAGEVALSAEGGLKSLQGEVTASGLDIHALAGIKQIGTTDFNTNFSLANIGKNIEGELSLDIEKIVLNDRLLTDISVEASKEATRLFADIKADNHYAGIQGNVEIDLDKEARALQTNLSVDHLDPALAGIKGKFAGYNFSGSIKGDVRGSTINDVTGWIELNDIRLQPEEGKGLTLNRLRADGVETPGGRSIYASSDWFTLSANGVGNVSALVDRIRNMVSEAAPVFVSPVAEKEDEPNITSVKLQLKAVNDPYDFFGIKWCPYTDATVTADVNENTDEASFRVNAPYILKGTNKLIKNIQISGNIAGSRGLQLNLNTDYPLKHGYAQLKGDISVKENHLDTELGWVMENSDSYGKIVLDADAYRNPEDNSLVAQLHFHPSGFTLNGVNWDISESLLQYDNRHIDVDRFLVGNGSQSVTIQGTASDTDDDKLTVKLNEIDLSYIFDILNIEYVNFGGLATGQLSASSLFSGKPVAHTDILRVHNFSYNEAVLGDAELTSSWIQSQKEIAIKADIDNHGLRSVVDGGIWLGRDSLSFDMNVDKINIAFLQPFLSAITSDIQGKASGKVLLYGTFKDINLNGRAMVDSIAIKVDYTNVYYSGADSVYLHPDHIEIPSFTIYDKEGHTVHVRGDVRHHTFHNAQFDFNVTNADNLLVLDLPGTPGEIWYGHIYASGGGRIFGRPGFAGVMMDMRTMPGSSFTFVLEDTQVAEDYTFLTFTDRRKAAFEKVFGTVDIEEEFRKRIAKTSSDDSPSIFDMNLRVSADPGLEVILVMDPTAGDKIRARGNGTMQLDYDTESDRIDMYGKYTLTEGNYNFSLQDLILRDFKIKEGSSIAFDGDPLRAHLDIEAAYRVNTNLSDLDKSFEYDRDLNRTNVPVDAILKVEGEMTEPEISFDIKLPTLTSDVERKVKSIISTEDMLSRQIIYLLALNRFYTPEYMTASGNGGELASVASSTISSQLSSMMERLTDKVTLAPSFRSDRGDFSDMEVDLALSSRLLNNRLLINGNFGYRDRSTSQTTFVGDFDIEYLLSKNGDLRLKAYNHFNDQNYYLKSSLTTQGIGLVLRKEFNNPFTFLRRRKKLPKERPLQTE